MCRQLCVTIVVFYKLMPKAQPSYYLDLIKSIVFLWQRKLILMLKISISYTLLNFLTLLIETSWIYQYGRNSKLTTCGEY